MAPVVAVSGLTKRYGALTALDAAACTLRPGEVLGLIGPNGAGKTTLLECLAGLRPFDTGTIAINGQTVPPGAPDGRLFYLPDGIAPWPAERVSWVLDYAVGFFGGHADARAAMVDALALSPLLGARIETLSKGQRKRVLLALGLVVPHPVLLCDEPFDGLDLRQTRAVIGLLRRHATRTSRSLLVSVHPLTDAARVSDRLLLLTDGHVVGHGTLQELRERAGRPGADRATALIAESCIGTQRGPAVGASLSGGIGVDGGAAVPAELPARGLLAGRTNCGGQAGLRRWTCQTALYEET